MGRMVKRVLTSSSGETEDWGRRLAKYLRAGDVISLTGELGSGKTVFVKGVARGLGVAKEVSSPSFVLLKIYPGKLPLYHFDLYRIDAADFSEIGGEEFFNGDGVVILEWGEKLGSILPANALRIKFERGTQEEERVLEFYLNKEWEERLEGLW